MFVILLLPIYYVALQNNKDKTLFWFGVLLLFILSAFRATTVGVDTVGYMATYRAARMTNISAIWDSFITNEPLYKSIEYYCSKWGLSYRFFMGVQTFFFLTPIATGLQRLREKPIASLAYLILLGYFFCSLNITRQLLALSFCFLSYVLLEEKKYIWSILVLLLAPGFHTTALLAVVVYALYFVKPSKYIFIGLLLVSYIVPLMYDLSSYMIQFVESISVFDSFLFYIEDDFTDIGRLPIYNTLRTGIFVFALFNYKPKDRERDLFFNLSLLAVIVHNLLYGVPSWAGRIVYYFDIAFIVFFVRWSKKNTIVTIITLVYAFIYYAHHYILQHQEGIFPFVLDF